MTQDTLSPSFRTSVLPSVLRSFVYVLFVGRQLNASADLFHTNRMPILDHHPYLTVVQRTDDLDQFLFCIGQYNIGISLHFQHLQTKNCGSTKYRRSRFSAKLQDLFAHRAGTKKRSYSRRSSDLCLKRWPVCLLRINPMTDFRQRQAISTLTAPAVRGFSPHYLVQPDRLTPINPATGTNI